MSDEYEVPTMMAKATGADRSDSATVGITPEEMVIRERVVARLRGDPKAAEIYSRYEREKMRESEELNRTIFEAREDHGRRMRELNKETDKAMRERWDEIEAEIRAQGVTPPKIG